MNKSLAKHFDLKFDSQNPSLRQKMGNFAQKNCHIQKSMWLNMWNCKKQIVPGLKIHKNVIRTVLKNLSTPDSTHVNPTRFQIPKPLPLRMLSTLSFQKQQMLGLQFFCHNPRIDIQLVKIACNQDIWELRILCKTTESLHFYVSYILKIE